MNAKICNIMLGAGYDRLKGTSVVYACCMFCVGPPLVADALGVEMMSIVVVVISIFVIVGRVVVRFLYIALPFAV